MTGLVLVVSDADGPANSTVGQQENSRIHRRGRADVVRLYLQEGDLAQLTEQYSRRYLYG